MACYFYIHEKARLSKIYSGFILFFAFALFVGTVLSDNTVAKVGKKDVYCTSLLEIVSQEKIQHS